MIYEFCAENVTLLEKAMQAGARRIELCDNLAVGGTPRQLLNLHQTTIRLS